MGAKQGESFAAEKSSASAKGWASRTVGEGVDVQYLCQCEVAPVCALVQLLTEKWRHLILAAVERRPEESAEGRRRGFDEQELKSMSKRMRVWRGEPHRSKAQWHESIDQTVRKSRE